MIIPYMSRDLSCITCLTGIISGIGSFVLPIAIGRFIDSLAHFVCLRTFQLTDFPSSAHLHTSCAVTLAEELQRFFLAAFALGLNSRHNFTQ